MKRKLLLYLAGSDYSGKISIAATLAWLTGSKDCLFDNYYDCYHQGGHFPAGDSRILETGQLTGGTVCGNRHFEELYFALHKFDVSVISSGESIFLPCIKNLNVPVVSISGRINVLYKKAFSFLSVPLPSDIVMIGTGHEKGLSGLDSYLYPEIYYRRAVGVPSSISEEELADLCQEGGRILCFYVDEKKIGKLRESGYDVEIIDELKKEDDYLSVTERIVRRWDEKSRGWILGDPTLVAHWLPTACEDDLISFYSVPQEKIISRLGGLISLKGKVVYGRQYSDRDFFTLSKLNQCLQVIDPYRPPFQSVRHAEYSWRDSDHKEGFYEDEYSDEELRRFAGEGRILISLMLWSGMIREIENFYNLMDLIAITRLRCGLVMTAQSYEYMMHSPLELTTVALEQGGVFPLVEPVLGSCGIGVGIESYITKERLEENLRDGLSRIFQKVKKEGYMPRGWWTTMDTDLKELGWREKPKRARLLKYYPYLQIRYHQQDKRFAEDYNSFKGGGLDSARRKYTDRFKKFITDSGLMKYFESYRPFEFYEAGTVRKEVVEAAKSSGLQYMFTKAGFNAEPEALYADEDFIALNYTSGQWDGWTPFETVNDVTDLKKSEKKLLKRNKPGWIVSTIDSCLWTFSGEFWRRGHKLYEIARFCADGGRSKKLINVKPYTVARYARIIGSL